MSEEQDRLNRCFKPEAGSPVGDWSVRFAWRPKVTEDRGVAWLRKVWMREVEHEDAAYLQYAWYEEEHVLPTP